MSSGNMLVGRISSDHLAYGNEYVQVMKCSHSVSVRETCCPSRLSFKLLVKLVYLMLYKNKLNSRIVIYRQTDEQGETNRRIFCNFVDERDVTAEYYDQKWCAVMNYTRTTVATCRALEQQSLSLLYCWIRVFHILSPLRNADLKILACIKHHYKK